MWQVNEEQHVRVWDRSLCDVIDVGKQVQVLRQHVGGVGRRCNGQGLQTEVPPDPTTQRPLQHRHHAPGGSVLAPSLIAPPTVHGIWVGSKTSIIAQSTPVNSYPDNLDLNRVVRI